MTSEEWARESVFAIQREAEVAFDPGVFVVDDGVDWERGRGDGNALHFLDGRPDGHEFHQAAAKLGDVGFHADHVFQARHPRCSMLVIPSGAEGSLLGWHSLM